MNARVGGPRTSLLPWSLFGLSVAGNVTGMVLLALVPAAALERIGDSVVLSGSFVVVLLVFGLVGAVVAARMPGNPIGWLFLTLAVMQAATQVTYGAAHYSTAVSRLPGEEWLAWFATWSSVLPPAVLCVTCLVYPDGRLVSPRWRWPIGGTLLAIGFVVLRGMTEPGPLAEFPEVLNPAGVLALEALRTVPTEPMFLLALGLGAASLVVRFRRSRGVERAQVKWFAWSAGLLAGFLPVSTVMVALFGSDGDTGTGATVAGLVFAALLCGLPVSVGIAIMRYRLYDIDVVIKRTLVYGSLTAVLAAVYLVSVLTLRTVLAPVAGEGDLAVAVSTLAVAGLFRPLRERVQAAVDQRFYRSSYDMGRTLEAFGTRSRDEVDLGMLAGDLRAVVRRTMQPTHVSLWLREGP